MVALVVATVVVVAVAVAIGSGAVAVAIEAAWVRVRVRDEFSLTPTVVLCIGASLCRTPSVTSTHLCACRAEFPNLSQGET